LKYSARKEGFKVIKVKTFEGWYIRIFGDSQQEVDCFLNLYHLGHEEEYIFERIKNNINKILYNTFQ